MLLAVEPSLPIMAVVSLVSAVAGGTATGTLAVVAFLRRQRDNARAIAALSHVVNGDKNADSHATQLRKIKEWNLHSERKHFAVTKGLDEDHPVNRLWPASK